MDWLTSVDWLSSPFLASLLAIIVIDLVLAGDNAIVIALAARQLPADLQKRAILWGTLGAVVVRASLTVVVVSLLKIPGLMLAGGLLLIWIACKLLVDNDSTRDAGDIRDADASEAGQIGHARRHGGRRAPTTFWAAMRTIIIADGVMGVDNMLAVAGASHGSVTLVVLGLVISIPIMVWGSTLILKIIDRLPALLYVGGAVLAWTAARMVLGEPMLTGWLAERPWVDPAFTALVIAGVLGLAFMTKIRIKIRRATPLPVKGDQREISDPDRRIDGLAARRPSRATRA